MLHKLTVSRLFAAMSIVAIAIFFWIFATGSSTNQVQQTPSHKTTTTTVIKPHRERQQELTQHKKAYAALASEPSPHVQTRSNTQKTAKVAPVTTNATKANTGKVSPDPKAESHHVPASSATAAQRVAPPTNYGMTIAGRTFAIGSFSGTGTVPSGNVYQWTGAANYYLADALGAAGTATRSLGVGSVVTLRGQVLHVRSIMQHVNCYAGNAALAEASRHSASIQTCINGYTDMNVYFLD